MMSWPLNAAPHAAPHLLGGWIDAMGQPDFGGVVLAGVQELLPAASWSVYRLGAAPAMYLSASCGVPDTTQDCWRAYLSGPHRSDMSFGAIAAQPPRTPLLCHLTAQDAPPEHRAKVYDAHGMAERLSLAQEADGGLLAINFYRHVHQPAFDAAARERLGQLAPALMALVRKHVALCPPSTVKAGALTGVKAAPGASVGAAHLPDDLEARVRRLCPTLSSRELAVCVRLLRGLTLEGIAADLGLALPTVKTYRQRAFNRLGIHFRNELFARVLREV